MQEPWKTDKWFTSPWCHLPEVRKDLKFRNDIKIYDVTLRDGEQAPGFSLRPAEKIQLARQLDTLGVDVIEAGYPIASAAEADAVRRHAGESHRQSPLDLVERPAGSLHGTFEDATPCDLSDSAAGLRAHGAERIRVGAIPRGVRRPRVGGAAPPEPARHGLERGRGSAGRPRGVAHDAGHARARCDRGGHRRELHLAVREGLQRPGGSHQQRRGLLRDPRRGRLRRAAVQSQQAQHSESRRQA